MACEPHNTVIAALGSPITFAEQTSALIAEMSRRGRQAFADSPNTRRSGKDQATQPSACIHNIGEKCAVIRSRDVASPSAHPTSSQLHTNTTPAGDAFLKQTTTEQWAAWQSRTLRSALVHLQRNKIERWSSYILKRIWSLWGHMARGGLKSTA